ncbi:protein of unknown function UPF0253 [Tolumonas auensis DSM 9187]|uniref:Uncharacterized protein n=1 Tax=Tolumonas auensis (strain DSM 9187 / NBRC 110442 / TA 4) TaxID=595494 RepID=C4LEJ1_TOLAT|nr:YaeP family protein [Tolumonas auensis]ACQ93008.1 protein of unknown function UPF0253 [Tolumonas auensis DSM 9187]
MKHLAYCEKIREVYSQIGSGDQGYMPNAISVVLKTLDQIANNPDLPEDVRDNAAFAAANLLISDYSEDA